jgi:hypothetical protein
MSISRVNTREPRKQKLRGDSIDEDEETGAGIITETVGSYTDESGNKVQNTLVVLIRRV